jgi:hypothetical protein
MTRAAARAAHYTNAERGQKGQISIFQLESKPITNLSHGFVIGFGPNGKIEI